MASMWKCPYCGKYQGALAGTLPEDKWCECGSDVDDFIRVAVIETHPGEGE